MNKITLYITLVASLILLNSQLSYAQIEPVYVGKAGGLCNHPTIQQALENNPEYTHPCCIWTCKQPHSIQRKFNDY